MQVLVNFPIRYLSKNSEDIFVEEASFLEIG